MATISASAHWKQQNNSTVQHTSIWHKWLAIADTQAPQKTLWFMVSLISQGVLFLPIPAILMYYFNAPIFVLGITMVLFFLNFIAGMGGSNIRTTLTLFVISIAVHLSMLLFFIF